MQPNPFDRDDAAAAEPAPPPDQAARLFAVDPAHHVVLEASAGTGKTRVLVDRYVRLLAVGVDPRNILAMTFTRKAAAEMRARVIDTVERLAAAGGESGARMLAVRARLADVEITTIDGFCFRLLREFPLEADVDPAFEVADETEMARFVGLAIERTMDVARQLAGTDESVRLLLTRVKAPVLRDALATLVDRRHVAVPAVARFVARTGPRLTAPAACEAFLERVRTALAAGSRAALVDDGPIGSVAFQRLVEDIGAIEQGADPDPSKVRLTRRRLAAYFLTTAGKPRQRIVKPYGAELFPNAAAKRRHEEAVARVSPAIAEALDALDRDLDALLARGVLRALQVAVHTYDRLLEENGLLDFAAMLERSVRLLERQEEFARSRLKLQSRYHHLLLDEFQDTSRLQWRLVDLLIGSWGEGEGAADAATSVFIVGDRKQSIYRFRHAEVTLLDEAAARIEALRGGRPVRQAISASFRSVPQLLAFVNAVAREMTGDEETGDAWRYEAHDRFPTPPVEDGGRRDGEAVVGLVAESTIEREAAAVGDEIGRLLTSGTIRDGQGGRRRVQPDDIAILFRARAGHQYFEAALAARGVRTYVYKGLGFFDAPEVQDLQALLGFLAAPESDLAAAAFLRSRFVRVSDQALVDLAPSLATALVDPSPPAAAALLGPVDAGLLARVRQAVPHWLALTRELPPGDLVDRILHDTGYVFELGGPRRDQAWENVKKVRSLVRRVESRGYATFDRLAAYFDTLRAGDDANAVVEAVGAVSLMTIHAAKGLEFPVVFVVNLQAAGRGRPPGFSVIERGPDGEPEVTFGSTAGTALEERRDAEELRRLLYVAVTRARDRLYLAAKVKPGERLARARRTLAGLLPSSLSDLIVAAADGSGPDEVAWTSGGETFALAICRPAPEIVGAPAVEVPSGPPPPHAAVPPLQATSLDVEAATAALGRAGAAEAGDAPSAATGSSRLVGTLVHRLLQAQVDPSASDDVLAGAVSGLVGSLDVSETDGVGWVVEVIRVYRALACRAELQDLLRSGAVFYEVPYSFLSADRPGVVIRGIVDCVVVHPSGERTVVEFKTGVPRPEHQAQAERYARALDAILGPEPTKARVFYP